MAVKLKPKKGAGGGDGAKGGKKGKKGKKGKGKGKAQRYDLTLQEEEQWSYGWDENAAAFEQEYEGWDQGDSAEAAEPVSEAPGDSTAGTADAPSDPSTNLMDMSNAERRRIILGLTTKYEQRQVERKSWRTWRPSWCARPLGKVRTLAFEFMKVLILTLLAAAIWA